MNQNEKPNPTAAEVDRYRPRFALYHPKANGAGGAVEMELHPAHDDHEGSIVMTLANQKSAGSRRGPTPVFPTFDWENRICVKLDFSDLCAVLQVLRGECESIGDGRGLYHRYDGKVTRIILRHLLEPVAGYSLEVYRSSEGQETGENDLASRIFFNPSEALGLTIALENVLGVICFGIPKVYARRASSAASGEARQPGRSDVNAA